MYYSDAASSVLAVLITILVCVVALGVGFLILVLICRHRQTNGEEAEGAAASS